MLSNRIILAVVVILGVPSAMVGYVAVADWLVNRLPYKWRDSVRPWFWAGPALLLLIFYLVYPTIRTGYLSLYNGDSTEFVGIQNYANFVSNQNSIIAVRNNIFWVIGMGGVTVLLGLLLAILFDRVRYEPLVKALIFVPMAISFVAASVIWRLQYGYEPATEAQTGTVNFIITQLGGNPVPLLVDRLTNNPSLIWIGIWTWTGFAVVILSAALKGIPQEIIESARVDGANEWQIMTRIIIPMMASTIAVVSTTLTIFALKSFDIPYVMTNGNFGTDVVALRMYKQLFNFHNFGRASALAIILLAATVPVMIVNIRRFRQQEAIR